MVATWISRLSRLSARIWWPLLAAWLLAVSALVCEAGDWVWLPPSVLAKDWAGYAAWAWCWEVLMALYANAEAMGLMPLFSRLWPVEGIPLAAPLGLLALVSLLWATAAALVMRRVSARLSSEATRSAVGDSRPTHPTEPLVVEPVFHGAVVESLEARLYESEESLGTAGEHLLAARQALLNASLQPDGLHLPEDLAAARAALDGLEQQLAALRGQQHSLMAGLVNLATDGR